MSECKKTLEKLFKKSVEDCLKGNPGEIQQLGKQSIKDFLKEVLAKFLEDFLTECLEGFEEFS